MGQTLTKLSSSEIGSKSIFNNRFVIEICEAVHVHYRNLRILLSLTDFIEIAEGFSDALARWKQRNSPEAGKGVHIELCRKKIAVNSEEGSIKINHNRNLYLQNEGKIFSEGAELAEPDYVHLKIRDLRIELTNKEFDALAECVLKAKELRNGTDSPG